ncbi:Methylthioribose-1-phosphate isomerase [Desulfamplus magnetovallimortis]|uniref:Methylthioribose-1-phosphate isomerase n=1 Tax=Desulfamplus magnetovallimortis TaxID=1246637 RepID=A0A1W1HGS9_9BACT|nr:S-methyl-5-thioribose-1-phosphate isomerase [Desulfamplus magnetovallimortis]SLM31646.1 Methylthioribose-1-phosphate isomerase [Desulfamplus magnetovallimortis]
MKVDGNDMRPIWFDNKTSTAKVIDQRKLPHKIEIVDLPTVDHVIMAIKEMLVRGAPLIGATGAFGVYTILFENRDNTNIKNNTDQCNNLIQSECKRLKNARPTAINLAWGVDRVMNHVLKEQGYDAKMNAALEEACFIVEEEAENCKNIGEHGASLIEEVSRKKQNLTDKTVNILTHCNAGWLATVEYGTATAPMYVAFDKGIDIHVWVDETRPLNQGARLTAWELGKHGIKHTVITDNAGGHIMQHGMVDLVIVGTDRTTRTGDVANKIGTYLKALAAKDNNIPFYVALPSSTFDWSIKDGLAEIPIEERDPDEIRYIQGLDINGKITSVLVPPEQSPAANHAFDVTPARLVTGFVTERGICKALESDILSLFPEQFSTQSRHL